MQFLASYLVVGLGIEGKGCSQLVATCVEVSALDERREVEFHSAAQVLRVGHANLALVVHLSLKGRVWWAVIALGCLKLCHVMGFN